MKSYSIVPALVRLPFATHQVQDNESGRRSASYTHSDAIHVRDWLELRARGYKSRRAIHMMGQP